MSEEGDLQQHRWSITSQQHRWSITSQQHRWSITSPSSTDEASPVPAAQMKHHLPAAQMKHHLPAAQMKHHLPASITSQQHRWSITSLGLSTQPSLGKRSSLYEGKCCVSIISTQGLHRGAGGRPPNFRLALLTSPPPPASVIYIKCWCMCALNTLQG